MSISVVVSLRSNVESSSIKDRDSVGTSGREVVVVSRGLCPIGMTLLLLALLIKDKVEGES